MRLLAPSRGTHTYWTDKDPVIFEGVIGLTKDRLFPGSLEYFIGDGAHKYSELPKYGGAEASSTKKNNTLVLRDGSGKIDSASLPDATSSAAGAVKASTTKAADNVVKADSNGGLSGWKESIINAIISDDGSGGLGTDTNGNMIVDFNQMPTDKFEALLKSLKMLIPLSADMDLYVDTNSAAASDTVVDGRGTEALPFKTIQGVVNFATSTYSCGSRTLTIKVKAGTYNESVTLPEYSYGTGGIVIKSASDLKDVIVDAPLRSDGLRATSIAADGGKWEIRRIIARRVENPTSATSYPVVSCFAAEGNSTRLYLSGCSAIQTLPADPTILATSNNYTVRVINVEQGAQIRIYPDTVPFEINVAKNTGTYPNVTAISVLRNSNITNVGTSLNDYDLEIKCSGSCDTFFSAGSKSQYDNLSGPNVFAFTGTVTGKKYALTGASCTNNTGGNTDFFPGNVAGTVDTATYCYYA